MWARAAGPGVGGAVPTLQPVGSLLLGALPTWVGRQDASCGARLCSGRPRELGRGPWPTSPFWPGPRCACIDVRHAHKASRKWTLEMDVALVQYINRLCRHLAITPARLHPHEVYLDPADAADPRVACLLSMWAVGDGLPARLGGILDSAGSGVGGTCCEPWGQRGACGGGHEAVIAGALSGRGPATGSLQAGAGVRAAAGGPRPPPLHPGPARRPPQMPGGGREGAGIRGIIPHHERAARLHSKLGMRLHTQEPTFCVNPSLGGDPCHSTLARDPQAGFWACARVRHGRLGSLPTLARPRVLGLCSLLFRVL